MPRKEPRHELESDPQWYKDAIIYELHVRAFADSDADGIGDFRGLTQKLDYLQDLGVTAIWLLPFYPSPLRDDGYDTSDYMGVHANYGTMRDVQAFVREAHRRGLRVITELVLNHTSDQHPWFQRARRAAPGSRQRDFYVWSDTPERYRDVRLIFPDFETSNWSWDPVAKAYYWHRFYGHQPDLNWESTSVHRAMYQVLDHWMSMGIDGLRLDAIPYLYEEEGTSCENLPQTHDLLKRLRAHVDGKFRARMFLAEANQWPEDAAEYFGEGDECHMAFHFPVMPRLFMAVRMEDRYPIIEILEQTPAIPERCQWALFLRNHDELTLEMVTDEDRDYMYRVYAQDVQARVNLGIRRRLAPLLGNHRRRIELMNGLLFSLPGTPVIYYGDEIGMGDNIYQGDRNSVRSPMQWSADRNAGFSRANPQQLYLPVIIDPEYHYETVNVEAQQNNPHSLLWWMKRVIGLRKRYKAFGRGSIEFLQPENRKVLAFLRRYEDETLLVVANLSRFVQAVELDMRDFEGAVPVEMFGGTEFPPFGELPYFLTLGPHEFYWFSIERQRAPVDLHPERRLPSLRVRRSWAEVFSGRGRHALEEALPGYLRNCRWFAGKARKIRSAHLVDAVPVSPQRRPTAYLALVRVDYAEGEPETYVLPIGYATEEFVDDVLERAPHAAIADLHVGDEETGLLFDALWEESTCLTLLDAVGGRRTFSGQHGELACSPTKAFRRLRGARSESLEASALGTEQSNTSVVYGDRLILKLFRRPEAGINPDLEIGRFLTERPGSVRVPQVAGSIEYRRGRGAPLSIAIVQQLIENEGDAWRYTLDAVRAYFETVLASTEAEPLHAPPVPALSLVAEEIPEHAHERIGPYLESAALIGRRTAELHVALAQGKDEREFAPEPMSDFYRRGVYQSMRTLTLQNLKLLRQHTRRLSKEQRAAAERVLGLEDEILRRLRSALQRRVDAKRIRVHGDYHLGQVLFTGKDFVIIDFEGEPARPLSERRLKRVPLRDVAGMLRSFHYAAHAALFDLEERGLVKPEQEPDMEAAARYWHTWVSVAFLKEYLDVVRGSGLVPEEPEALQPLVDAFLLEKAVYELGYELNNRPAWVRVPVQGILDLVEEIE